MPDRFLSEPARAALAVPRVEEPFPALDDTEVWLRLIEAANAESRAQYEGVEFAVRIEERQIAGVPTYVLRADEVADGDRRGLSGHPRRRPDLRRR